MMVSQLSDVTGAIFSYTPQGIPPNTRRPQQAAVQEEAIDPRDIDKVITEAAGMASRWNLFRRFLFDRLKVQILTVHTERRTYCR